MPRSSVASTSTSSPVSERIVKTYKRRPRKPISCEPCRHSKLRCDRQKPCVSCIRRKCVDSCVYERPSATPERPEPASTPCPPRAEHSTPESGHIASVAQGLADIAVAPKETANTGPADLPHERWEEVLQRPMNPDEPSAFAADDAVSRAAGNCFPFPSEPQPSMSEILALVPPAQSCDYLISRFFMYMSQFFPVLHGPTFQREFAAFIGNPSGADLSWLALLFMLLSIGLHTLDYDGALPADISPIGSSLQDANMSTRRYREAAMICLSKDQFLTRYRLSTLQALLLIVYEICHEEGVE